MISPESQGGPNIALITIVCGWTFLAIALIFVGLMLWYRRIRKIEVGLDDYLIILALAMTIALIAQTTWAIVDEGQANHEVDVPVSKIALVVRSLLVNETLWALVNTFVRSSVVLSINRMFGISRVITYSLLVVSALYGLAVILEAFLICRPMAVDWDAAVSGRCGDQIVSYLVLEVLGLILDAATLALPILNIWSLHLQRAGRIRLSMVFSVGALVFIVTGLRLQALHMVNAQDFIYSKGYLGLLSALGASLGIICCCAPYVVSMCRLLYKRAKDAVHTDEEHVAISAEDSSKTSFPTTSDHVTESQEKMARWSLDVNIRMPDSLHTALN